MHKKLIDSIQKQLFEIVNKKFSTNYICTYIFPIFEYVVNSKKTKFLIAGSQGVGKTTLLYILDKNLKIFYNKKILSLGLDDYYLTKKQRISLSKKIHPLLLTRGVPGTHDIAKLFKDIKCFEKSKYPIHTPIFNKLNDDRSSKVKTIKQVADILLLDGWCCGSTPLSNDFLLKNDNSLEKKIDKDKKWRIFYNKQLKHEYNKLFKLFDRTIFLKAPSFSFIVNWRLQQEKMMATKNKMVKEMNKKDILQFIQHYEKITKWMMKTMPSQSDLCISVNKKQKIIKLKYN